MRFILYIMADSASALFAIRPAARRKRLAGSAFRQRMAGRPRAL